MLLIFLTHNHYKTNRILKVGLTFHLFSPFTIFFIKLINFLNFVLTQNDSLNENGESICVCCHDVVRI